MKKFLISVLVVVAVGAAGWSAIWFWGKGQLEGLIDREIAALDRQGWSVTYQERRIQGFPGRYNVSVGNLGLVERESGALIRLSEVTLNAMPVLDDKAEMMLPTTFSLMLPVSTSARLSNPNLPPRIELTGESRDWVLAPQSGGARVTADHISLVLDQAEMPWQVQLEIDRLDLTASGSGPRKASLSAGQIRTRIEAREPVEFQDAEMVHRDLKIEADFMAENLSDLINGVLGDRSAWAKGTFSAGAFDLTVHGPAEGAAETTTSKISDSATTGSFEIGKGRADYQIQTTDLAVTIDLLDTQSQAETVAVQFSAKTYRRDLRIPFAAAREKPQLAEVTLDLGEITGDANFWSLYDPEDALDRSPGAASIAIKASVASPNGVLPTMVTNISVEDVTLRALGSRLAARGDIEVLHPAQAAEGVLEVQGSGLRKTLGDLRRAGLIPDEAERTGEAMLQVYARPGAGPDEWETDISVVPGGISVNGLPVR